MRRKGYNQLAKDNSIVFMPGAFRDGSAKKKAARRGSKRDHSASDCDPDVDCEAQAGRASRGQRGRRANRGAADDPEEFIKKQVRSLIYHKTKREGQFEARVVSDRVKGKVMERKARMEEETVEAERLWKMQELERREEKERADRWKDRRLARLEKEKRVAETELAREKVERKQSKLQRVFKEQQRRHEEEEHWKKLREETKLAAQRAENLSRERDKLESDLRATGYAFREACNQRDNVMQEKEEERTRRLRAERSLHRWKELMKEYFPGGQQQQQPELQMEQPLSLEAQFELYEKKWEILRSGIDMNGTKVPPIHFCEIPWPVVNITLTDPSQIQAEHIQEFLMHPLREKPDARGKARNRWTKVKKVKDELLRWHSDRFDQVVLSKVREEDKAAAFEAGGLVNRVLTEMLK